MNETIQRTISFVNDVLSDALRGGCKYVALFLVGQIQIY